MPMSAQSRPLNFGVMVALTLIFLVLLYKNMEIDKKNDAHLGQMVCHKEVKLPSIHDTDVLIIESVIEKYWKKCNMNKSNTAKIWGDIKMGAARGVLGGAIVGSGPVGALTSAVVFGTLSGVSRAYSLTYGSMSFLNVKKHT